MERERHALYNINVKNRTATCKVCGSVSIVKNGFHQKSGKRQYRCAIKGRAKVLKYQMQDRYHQVKGLDKRVKLPIRTGTCDICGRIKGANYNRRMSLDHCHQRMVPRGWLCTHCNFGIARFFDSPELLITAANYLVEANERIEKELSEDNKIPSTMLLP